tara:strand:- start:580 stop:1002 length:423 start_codon:yes stop_codon:yes gene_type:complete
MQIIAHHIKWFYYYTFYVGIALRKRIRKKGTDKQDVLEMNSQFWLALLNGFLIATVVSPIFTNEQELISGSNVRKHLDFTIPFIIKYGIDYYFFYWNKDWVRIVHEFENNISKKVKRLYLLVFLTILTLSFCFMYTRWFL